MTDTKTTEPNPPLTREQVHYRVLQGMLKGRRRLSEEERNALSFASTLVAARGFEETLPDDG